MITIRAKSPAEAWVSAMLQLFDKGRPEDPNGFFKNACAAIEITDVFDALYHDCFPMSWREIEAISQFLITGKGNVNHDWTRIYRERIFDGPEDYISKIVRLLEEGWSDCPRAQITAWNNDTDHVRQDAAPCLQMLWFKILDKTVHLHVHMRTSDCYGKLLMNFNEFISLQKHVAKRLGLPPGTYVHFIDSLHFHNPDAARVTRLCEQLRAGT